jgi:putative acetyltransferase
MKDVYIRRYVPCDLDCVLAVRRDSIRNIAARDYTPDQILAWAPDKEDRDALATRFAGTLSWVAARNARDNDDLLGFINLDKGGYLDCLYIHSKHQGRGIATALLQKLEAAARDQRLSLLFSNVSITARPFFEGRGFKVVAAQKVTIRNQAYDNFRMEKRL